MLSLQFIFFALYVLMFDVCQGQKKDGEYNHAYFSSVCDNCWVTVEEFSWNFLLEVDRQSRIGAAKRQVGKPPDLQYNDDLERAASTVCSRPRFKFLKQSARDFCSAVLGNQEREGTHKRAFIQKYIYEATKVTDVPLRKRQLCKQIRSECRSVYRNLDDQNIKTGNKKQKRKKKKGLLSSFTKGECGRCQEVAYDLHFMLRTRGGLYSDTTGRKRGVVTEFLNEICLYLPLRHENAGRLNSVCEELRDAIEDDHYNWIAGLLQTDENSVQLLPSLSGITKKACVDILDVCQAKHVRQLYPDVLYSHSVEATPGKRDKRKPETSDEL